MSPSGRLCLSRAVVFGHFFCFLPLSFASVFVSVVVVADEGPGEQGIYVYLSIIILGDVFYSDFCLFCY